MLTEINKYVLLYMREDLDQIQLFKDKHSDFLITKVFSDQEFSEELIEKNDFYIILGDWKGISLEKLGLRCFENYIFDWVLEVSPDDKLIDYNRLIQIVNERGENLDKYLQILKQNKALVYVYGNCQIYTIVQYLSSNETFIRNNYIILSNPIHRLSKEIRENGFPKLFLQHLSIFIYQYVAENNKFSRKLSTSFICENLNEKCKQLCIPNLYFTGYFPQFYKRSSSPLANINKWGNGLIPYGDAQIEKYADYYIKKEKTFKQCIQELTWRDLYSKEEIEQVYRSSIEELISREKRCQIYISDYIIKHWTEERLFWTVNHPSKKLVKELVMRIFRYLGYPQFCNEDKANELNEIEQLIFPCVKEKINLNFDISHAYFHRKYSSNRYGISEYVATYFKEFLWHEYIEKQEKRGEQFDFGKVCIYDDSKVKLRKEIVLSHNGELGHLSIMFKVKEKILNDIVFWLPYRLAPDIAYSTFCFSIEGNGCPVTISDIGEVRINMMRYSEKGESDIFIIDTAWNSKGKNKKMEK